MTQEEMKRLVQKGLATWLENDLAIQMVKTGVIAQMRPDLPGLPVEKKKS
jgi:hypothetical protein